MKVDLTSAAEADLEAIADWIASGSRRAALDFVADLRAACEGLARSPRAYPIISRYSGQEVRRRVHGRYLIFFRIEGRVVILHVLHGARDYEGLLDSEA